MLSKKLFSHLTVLSLLLTFGCASDSSNSSAEMADAVSDAADNYELELNGSSDGNNAGGLQTIFFDYDSAQLSPSSQTTLTMNAEFLKANSNVDIQVEGHTDERGGTQYNLALGERRARTVKNYLVALGVDASRISTVSYGKEKPLGFGHDNAAWSQNRRANFYITAK